MWRLTSQMLAKMIVVLVIVVLVVDDMIAYSAHKVWYAEISYSDSELHQIILMADAFTLTILY